MGFDRYWERPLELSAEIFARWSADVAKVIAFTDVVICGPDGEGEPIVTSSSVACNGWRWGSRYQAELYASLTTKPPEPYGSEEGALCHRSFDSYEPFIVSIVCDNCYGKPNQRGLLRASCRPGYRPYEDVVSAALILFAHYFPDFEVSSDYGIWGPGLALAQRATGRTLRYPAFRHGWWRRKVLNPDRFEQWANHVGTIVQAANIPLAGPDGQGSPIVTATSVWFNGIGEEGWESLVIEQDISDGSDSDAHGSCRTYRTDWLPYDSVVRAVLCLMQYHFPNECGVWTDASYEEWQPAFAFVERTVGINLQLKAPYFFTYKGC